MNPQFSLFDYPTYFLQTKEWTDFWQSSNALDHSIKFFSYESLSCFVYQYPWNFGQKFWYIPRFASIDSSSSANFSDKEQKYLNHQSLQLLEQILETAKSEEVSFVKFDFNDQLSAVWQCQDLESIKNKIFRSNFDYSTNLDTKIIQFTSTMFLDLKNLLTVEKTLSDKKSKEILLSDLEQFFEQNSKFWLNLEKNTRRGTKRSLEKNWEIVTEKTPQNFEIFYELLKETSKRQDFAIQTKEYLKSLFNQDFFVLILLKKDEKFLASWSGIISSNTLVNLYNGNLPEGFKDFSQYLLHLVAVYTAKQNGLRFYDFGGYNPSLSFSSFKDGYKGDIRNFLGPVDVILKPFEYKAINVTISALKQINKLTKILDKK